MFECYYKRHYVNVRVFQSTNSIIACLSGTTWRTEWTYHRSLTCSSIHHISFLSECIGLKRIHTRQPHTTIKTHKRSRCSKQRTTFQSIQFNICAEWTLPCLGIRTRPMGSSTFVLIYLYTHAFADKSDRGADLKLEHSVAKTCHELYLQSLDVYIVWVLSNLQGRYMDFGGEIKTKLGVVLSVVHVRPCRVASTPPAGRAQAHMNHAQDGLFKQTQAQHPCVHTFQMIWTRKALFPTWSQSFESFDTIWYV